MNVRKMAWALFIVSLLLIFSYAIITTVNDILELQETLASLNAITNNPEWHSGMVSWAISIVEESLKTKFTQLADIGAVAFLIVLATMVATNKGNVLSPVFKCLVGILLIGALLTPLPVSAEDEVTRYYARVEMDVPQDGHLKNVNGYITPHVAGIVSKWVCHHIAVGFPLNPKDPKWIGGGYVHDETKGTAYYIEWRVDGSFDEITIPGVVFNEPIWVTVDMLPDKTGWVTYVYDSYGCEVLHRSVIGLPTNQVTRGIAGGESINPENRMEASFSSLRWKAGYQAGFWDEDIFLYKIVHDAPYNTAIEVPYYKFTVSGGYGKTLLIEDAGSRGSTIPEAGAYVYTEGSEISVEATAGGSYTFEYWLLDQTKKYQNPIYVTMDVDHTLNPIFSYQPPPGGGPPSGPPRDVIWGDERDPLS